MYNRLGIHWASSTPAFLAIACLPFPFLFYKYGAAIRKKCKYAAQADAFMQRIRGQMAQQQQQGSSDSTVSSRTVSVQAEEDAEQEAVDYSYEDEKEPRFEEMKSGKEAEHGLEKTKTGRSTRSRRSTSAVQEYNDNPYDIDRVHTRESFSHQRGRADSRGSSKIRPVLSRSKSRQ